MGKEFEELSRGIINAPRLCCNEPSGKPHATTCRFSPEGMVLKFRRSLMENLQSAVSEGLLLSTDTIQQAIEKL